MLNSYYLDLIDWNDPDDPIRQLVIPNPAELGDWGRLDACDEMAVTRVPGLQHKYRDTALVLAVDTCVAYCRFCFRRRLFMRHNAEAARDLAPAWSYVRKHPGITDILLTGGDPLILSTPRLAEIVHRFTAIPHVRTIRIGSKTPSFAPYTVPLVRGWKLFDTARHRCSGLSRRVRFVMNRATGKIETVGVERKGIHLRYHRALDEADESRLMVARRDVRALWFDDLEVAGA